MPRLVRDWIESYLDFTDNSEAPKIYHEWVAVSVIASVLQRKCWLEWEKPIYPNLYIVLVGPSGCRKGTAMYFGASFLREAGIKLAAEAITREALIRELNGSTVFSTTPNGEQEMHASLTIYSEELTVFLGYNNIQLMQDLADWYDCRSTWKYVTKNMGTDDIVNVWVNLIGATTPQLIQSALPQDAVGGGLTSRMIFVYADKKGKVVPGPFMSPKAKRIREELATDLESIASISGSFEMSEKYWDRYHDWYIDQEKNPPISDLTLEAYLSRRSTHLRKVSMIMSASERDDRLLTVEHFDKAISLLERTESKMSRTFAGFGASRTSDVMAKVMSHIANSRVTNKKRILQLFYTDLEGEKQLDDMLNALSHMDFCRMKIEDSDLIIIYNKDHGLGRGF